MSAPTKLSLANRALQNVGSPPLVALTDNDKAATEFATCYDSLRKAELRRAVWRFSIRRAPLRATTDETLLVTPQTWDISITYGPGELVTYNGLQYISAVSSNLAANPETSDNWQSYFGPRTAVAWDEDVSYFHSEIVYTPASDVLIALTDDSDYVLVPDDWDAATAYVVGDRVWFGSFAYVCYDPNTNVEPDSGPAVWDSETAYVITNQVTYLGNIYQAAGSTTGDIPSDGAPWTFVSAAEWDVDPEWPGSDWLQIQATLTTPFIPYAPGAGSSIANTTRYIYFLPAGFLREAAQNPKAGNYSPLGAPSNICVTDWLFENGFLVSSEPGPILLRFAADIQNVGQFDPLFFEGLAARVSLEVCEPLTQSNTKLATLAQKYKQFMSDARAVNAIEKGTEELPMDDFLAARF